jgi:hypothetical protein
MLRRLTPALQVALWLSALALPGCGDESLAGDVRTGEAQAPSQEAATAATLPSAPAAQPPADGCLRGGTPRAEVQALLGAPDSISWGVWLYGRSEVTFGYGVVVGFADHDGNLRVCAEGS